MLYIVECSYNDPGSEEAWNEFYSKEKLPALVSVTGFSSSQRFRAVKPGCPVYLAIHTVKDADVLTSDDYRQKGGGHFSHGQAYITDWHRNLYACEGPAPVVSSDEILVVSARPISFIETELGCQALKMQAVGLDKSPEHRVIYVLTRENAALLAELPEAYLYEALTPQVYARN
ncbi:sugar ABC transporter [Pluralibacter sp.]|uniref:sugar ABC transporter n=1 Tax=Pluralibacter sp. TaxID=1920032 RepID=UPI0025EEAD1D|nr:sugar ABC transporter [Pluralibacter sp.]MBV8043076.1 sugar ABC transporter [Pluralibacter sp.]